MSVTNSEIKVGIAGLGKMGLLHAAVFNGLPGCRVVAAADANSNLRNGLGSLTAAAGGMEVFLDSIEMLDRSKLDAVVIATPVAAHVPIAQECVKRGIPFLMEKPLAISAEQASALASSLQRNPLVHMVGYMTRFVDTFAKGKEVLDTGCLGRLQRVTSSIYVSQLFTKGKGWRYDPQISGGGVLLSQGSHLLDLLTWYFGPVKSVNSKVQSFYSANIEDFAHLMLEFESGLSVFMDSSWSVRFRRTVETHIEILGDLGSLTLTDDDVRLYLDRPCGNLPAGWTTWSSVDLYRGVEIDIGGPQYTREDQAFADGIRRGISPEPNMLQALHVQKVVDAAYASSEKNGTPMVIK